MGLKKFLKHLGSIVVKLFSSILEAFLFHLKNRNGFFVDGLFLEQKKCQGPTGF